MAVLGLDPYFLTGLVPRSAMGVSKILMPGSTPDNLIQLVMGGLDTGDLDRQTSVAVCFPQHPLFGQHLVGGRTQTSLSQCFLFSIHKLSCSILAPYRLILGSGMGMRLSKSISQPVFLGVALIPRADGRLVSA